MRTILSNSQVRLEIDSHGAELCSIQYLGEERLWQADPAFWNRHSPVLFPIVGRVWDNVYRTGGGEYSLGQHGFARDMEFTPLAASENEAWFRLESSPGTLVKYPFHFVLEIGYLLTDTKIEVLWRVYNTADRASGAGTAGAVAPGTGTSETMTAGASETWVSGTSETSETPAGEMPFQIGAHPAFLYPEFCPDDPVHGYFTFGDVKEFDYILVKEKGCADTQMRYHLHLPDGRLPLDHHVFDADALIIENSQISEVTLCGKDGRPRLRLTFDTPVVGLWSPPGANAPFVCIEPWYGRCDRFGYTGDFKDKDWMNFLAPGECFEGGYGVELIG